MDKTRNIGPGSTWAFRYEMRNEVVVAFEARHIDLVMSMGHGPTRRTRDRPDMEGTVKWDGCMDITIGEHVMMHNCGPALDSFDELKRVAALIYEDAREMLGDKADW